MEALIIPLECIGNVEVMPGSPWSAAYKGWGESTIMPGGREQARRFATGRSKLVTGRCGAARPSAEVRAQRTACMWSASRRRDPARHPSSPTPWPLEGDQQGLRSGCTRSEHPLCDSLQTADGLGFLFSNKLSETSQASAGLHQRYRQSSQVLDCAMTWRWYLPPQGPR